MKIFAVDDSAVVRKIIKVAVEVLEFELEEAEDGIKALEVLENTDKKPDLILLDWNMPGRNGYDLLKILKANNEYKSIPVMMVTTESAKENIVNAIKAGAINYMVKPFTMEEMTKKILECLGRGSI